MSETRRRRSGGALEVKALFDVMDRNTYGGGKHERKRRSEMPVNPISKEDGIKEIKIRYGKASDRYPSDIQLLMTDGEWVKYRIDIKQPGFIPAEEITKRPGAVTGYKGPGK